MRERALAALRLASGGILLVLAFLGLHRTASDPTDGAVLVLAVRTMAGTAQDCRTLSETERASLPRHMQRTEICEPRAVPYRLELAVDGETRVAGVYRPAGIHGDRPITIDERIRVSSGTRTLRVRFEPAEREKAAGLPVFALDQPVLFEDGRVRIVHLEGTVGDFRIR